MLAFVMNACAIEGEFSVPCKPAMRCPESATIFSPPCSTQPHILKGCLLNKRLRDQVDEVYQLDEVEAAVMLDAAIGVDQAVVLEWLAGCIVKPCPIS